MVLQRDCERLHYNVLAPNWGDCMSSLLLRATRPCALLAAIASATLVAALLPAADQPNIVLLISDDHDNEHFGFMGSRIAHTPNVDLLARSGTLFTRAHLPMSRCHPTLASFLSGRWPHQTGVYHNFGTKRLDPANSLPSLLRDAGYATYVEGKYWEGDPRAMGFTHGKAETADTFVRDGQADLFAFIDDVGGRSPMFVWWAPKLPHRPHNPPEDYLSLIDRSQIPIPPWIREDRREAFLDKEHLSLAMEAWMDDGIGKLRTKLLEKGLYENTLFVFVTDNGWCNGLVSKGSPFEKGVRTPILFSWPAEIEAGQRFDYLTSTLDVYPTILDYADVLVPASAEGKSLRPIIEGRRTKNRERLYGAIYPAFVTEGDERPERDIFALYLRDDRWKYILFLQDIVASRNQDYFRIQSIETDYPTRQMGAEDLYDLHADPRERTNLAAMSEHSHRMAAMREAVFEWWRRTGGKPIDALEGED